jgi:hypothetical protein
MSADFNWKNFEFITTVQTGLINHGIIRSLDEDTPENRPRGGFAQNPM